MVVDENHRTAWTDLFSCSCDSSFWRACTLLLSSADR